MSIWGDDFVEIAWAGTLTGYRKKGMAGYLIGIAEQDAILEIKVVCFNSGEKEGA